MITLIKNINIIGGMAALASVFAMWFMYYFGTRAGGYAELLIFGLGIVVILCTILPAVFVKKYERGSLADLGIHTQHLWLLLSISAFLSIGSLFYYFQIASDNNVSETTSILLLLWSIFAFWEVVFVYGWLQIRYERVIGVIPAILFTGSSFAIYHIGSMPLEQILPLFGIGLVGAITFKLARHSIFILWPFFWTVGTAIGGIQPGGVQTIQLYMVAVVFVMFVAQVLAFRFIFLRNTDR